MLTPKCLFFILTITFFTPQSSSFSKDEASGCFPALYKIKSCSDDIVAYFSEGAIDITLPCCEAVTLITHHCWPDALTILGYGPDQIGILRGYCDALAPDGRSRGPAVSPVSHA